jgi:outer membrane lipoprotein carrier protein
MIAGADTAAQQLAGLLGQFNSLSAQFTQTLYDSHGRVLQKSHGSMELLRPDALRWETLSPSKQILITNGKQLWVYDVDLEQVQVKPLQKAFGNQPAMVFTSSSAEMQQHFIVSVIPAKQATQAFQLVPKDPQADFKWIRFYFSGNAISKMQINDKIGQLTEMVFSQVKRNPYLLPAHFNFIPPKGIDVINDNS